MAISTFSPSYDRSAIMADPWRIVRKADRARFSLRFILRNALRCAWRNAKQAAAIAAMPEPTPAEMQARIIEAKSFMSAADVERVRELRKVAAIERRDFDAMRSLIASAGGRFCSVTFIKKDGTRRLMRVQPAALPMHLKGAEACPSARKAAETRAERHPNLLPVWDAEKRAPRSVSLATVERITVDGATHAYA